MNQNIRTCSCGSKFIAPSMAPKASRCRRCHLEFKAAQKVTEQKAAEKGAAMRKIEEKKRADAEICSMLKEMYLAKKLPKHAKVTRCLRGSQVAVSWGGLSATFHTA